MTASQTRSEDPDPRIEWARFRDLWDRTDAEPVVAGTRVTTSVAASLWLLALFVVFLTWNGAAERTQVAAQIPYLVSGGLTVLLFTIAGAAVLLYGALMRAQENDAVVERPEREASLGSGVAVLDERRAG